MSSPILFFVVMALFIGLTGIAATTGSLITLIVGLFVVMGVSVFVRKRAQKNRKFGLTVEFLLFYFLSFVVLVTFWCYEIIEYDDSEPMALIKIALLSLFTSAWLMVLVNDNYKFPGVFRNILSKTLPDDGSNPPKTLSEAFALERPLKIRRALQANPHLLQERGTWGETPLHLMARGNDLKATRILLACGAEVDARDKSNAETPLHYAATEGHTRVMRALIRARADLNAVNQDGDTPLHWACHGGHFKTVRSLLREDADPRIRNNAGVDCLDVATEMGHQKIVSILKNHLDRMSAD